ncbi:insulator su(Hw) mRNA adaptor isoform X2 [Rhodnius prolixus]|uniref:insulator su(Hw) mRNA adaptor isoform X2 n=1 Tax=Rhodnius prolixus TaxID=13249 RepID=UPI003D18D62C
MEVVKAFNNELSSLYETRPPISKAKMTAITRSGIKAIKFYKHVVQSVEKFIQKCKPEYKVPGLYVIDSIVRQSRHQFTAEKDVFAPRFARNIQQTFLHLFNCPQDDKGKIVRVLNLWQKNQVFTPDVIQPLLDMASFANKDQLVVPPSSNGVQLPPSSAQPRTPTTKPSPVKDPSWLTSSVDINSTTAQPVPTPTMTSKLQPSTGVIDPNIMQQLQNLQNLLLDKQLEANNSQSKKDDTVKFDKKLLDFDYDEDDDEPPSPQQPSQPAQPPLPSIDSLQTILSNPEVLRQLQTLQQQMSSRQQQAEMEDKMRRLQEMRHQEEEFDKHLAQTLPNLPFASECDFKPSSSSVTESITSASLAASSQGAQALSHTDPVTGVTFTAPITAPPVPFVGITDSDERTSAADFDERRVPGGIPSAGSGAISISGSVDETSWEAKLGSTAQSSDTPIEIIDLIRTDSPVKSPSRSSRRRRSPSPRRSSRRSKSRSRSRSRRRRSRTRTRSRSRSRSKSREDRERERERRRRGLPPLKKNHIAVCSTTLWIGHLSKLVQQEELSDTFGEFGDIVSINLIPPRGCAFICMNRRQDASKALQQLKHFKLQGKAITIAWAPGKGMKDKEWKDYWEVEHGVSYIPWNKISLDTDLDLLEDGGVIDEDSLPEYLKVKRRELVKRNYASQMQQAQHMIKVEEEKEALRSNEPKGRNDMDIGNVGGNTGVPPAYIPLPDNSMAGAGPPTAQPPPGMPPPMGLLPPFALPPRLLGPMGPMGPLGPMGNVPLGVPPPLMMPPPPQQMVGRLPPPFNPPPQMGLMPPPTMATADGMDKSKLTQIPPPPTPDTFPELSSMVNPFGIPLPTIPNFGNTNMMPPTQPPVSQPSVSKMSTDMEVDVKQSPPEIKDVKPLVGNTAPDASSMSDNIIDRTIKELDRSSSTVSGAGGSCSANTGSSSAGGGNTSEDAGGGEGGIGIKDCDWRESSPRRRDRGERDEKRRRRDSPPSRRDDNRRGDDRRGGSNDDRRQTDDRRNEDRRGTPGDRRTPGSRWQSRQNKWQDERDRRDKRSSSPYSSNRPDKDERPPLLSLPIKEQHFHQGGPSPHHEQPHFNQGGSVSHHDQFAQGAPSKHPDQHYHQGSMGHEQYPQGPPPKSHHDGHYQQGPPPLVDQQYSQGPMPPHFRQHEQFDQHSPPLGYGGGRYSESERDEMMGGQGGEFPPRGFFNRGHARMPQRSPRPLLRTPNGPMFPPRGPPMGGPPCPPPMSMSLRGHRAGPPGNRMDGPGFMPPRGFPPPGLRGRGGGGGGRFSSGGRDEWEGPPRRRGWDEFPPNLPGPGSLMGGPPGHLGPLPLGAHGGGPPSGHSGPMHSASKSISGTSGSGGLPSLLGSMNHLRPPSNSGGNERRKSRWSTPESKPPRQQSPTEMNSADEKTGDFKAEKYPDLVPKEETEVKPAKRETSFESQEHEVGQPTTSALASIKEEPEYSKTYESQQKSADIFDSQNDNKAYVHESAIKADKHELETGYDEPEKAMFLEKSTTNLMDAAPPIVEGIPLDEFNRGMPHSQELPRRLSFDNNFRKSQDDPEIEDKIGAKNLYGDEILPITFAAHPPQNVAKQEMMEEKKSAADITELSTTASDVRYSDVEMKNDAPIFDIGNNSETNVTMKSEELNTAAEEQ